MKRISSPVQVEVENGRPRRLRWDGRQYRVEQVIDCWVVQGHWWTNEERRIYFRVLTDRGTLELYRSARGWVLTRLFD